MHKICEKLLLLLIVAVQAICLIFYDLSTLKLYLFLPSVPTTHPTCIFFISLYLFHSFLVLDVLWLLLRFVFQEIKFATSTSRMLLSFRSVQLAPILIRINLGNSTFYFLTNLFLCILVWNQCFLLVQTSV